ncbi:MAG: hypothetical protein U1E23_05250 [Reyranellaceae bacterium]
MARTPRGRDQQPPRDARNAELGQGDEERDRHLRYAHEQYSASGQGRFGASKGQPLPSGTPPRNERKYPRGTRTPWPDDRVLEQDADTAEPPTNKPVGS